MASVKNQTKRRKQEEIIDDVSDLDVSGISNVEETKDEELDPTILEALKAKMADKNIKTEEKTMNNEARSLKFGVVGSGQAGSRLALAMFELGYQAVCMNTAKQDLEFIKLPEENKLLLDYSLGGAAKDLSIGSEAAELNRDKIIDLIEKKLDESQLYLLCTSLGGGSGAGSAETLVNILSGTGKPVIVICVLPLSTDDAVCKNNSLQTLAKLSKMVQSKQIVNLIVVDNSKLEKIYNEVSQLDFFTVGNKAIVEPIDIFNKFSQRPSLVKSLDPMEWAKLLTDGNGLTITGSINVFDYTIVTSIAEAVMESLNSSLLASGFDLSQAKYGGVIFVGRSNVMSSIPRGAINYALALVKENCVNSEAIFHGIYTDDEMEDCVVKIHTVFSGLGLPNERIEQLKREAQAEELKVKNREHSHNLTLNLNSGVEENVSAADKVRELIKKKNSTFGRNFGPGVKDFRNKK